MVMGVSCADGSAREVLGSNSRLQVSQLRASGGISTLQSWASGLQSTTWGSFIRTNKNYKLTVMGVGSAGLTHRLHVFSKARLLPGKCEGHGNHVGRNRAGRFTCTGCTGMLVDVQGLHHLENALICLGDTFIAARRSAHMASANRVSVLPKRHCS